LTKKQKSTAEVEKSEPDCNNRRLERKDELHLAQQRGIHGASTPEVSVRLEFKSRLELPVPRAAWTPAFLHCRDKPHG